MDTGNIPVIAESIDDFDFQMTSNAYHKIQEVLSNLPDDLYHRLEKLSDIETKTFTRIFRSSSQQGRFNLERYLDAIYQITSELTNTGERYPKELLYYPTLNVSNFSQQLAQLDSFKRFYIPPITSESFKEQRSGEFKKTSSQQFSSAFISPDSPYNGILLWHGVGVGKTCSTVSIAEHFIDYYKSEGRKVLIVTPSEQLHETWRLEIFNLAKERMKNQYNQFIQQGYQTSFEKWLSLRQKPVQEWEQYKLARGDKPTYYPINNIQCTGNQYNPYQVDPTASRKRLLRIIKNKVDESYEFSTFNKIANRYKRTYDKISSKKRPYLEGQLVRYIVSNYSNRLIVMDEIHRVREDDVPKSRGKYRTITTDQLGIGTKVEALRDTQTGKYFSGIVVGTLPDSNHYQIKFNDGSTKNLPSSQVRPKQQSAMQLKLMVFQMIARYTQNTKMVLLTATPMYASAVEVIDLLNILRINDRQFPIKKSDIFLPKSNQISEEGEELLRTVSVGYVSFLRGENPTIFPVSLEPTRPLLIDPDDNSDRLSNLGYYPRPIYKFTSPATKILTERDPLDWSNDWIQNLRLFRDEMRNYQWSIWILICRHLESVSWSYGGLLQNRPPTHASIIVFPTFTLDETTDMVHQLDRLDSGTINRLKHSVGKKGFESTFIQSPDGGYTFQEDINHYFLDLHPPSGEVGIEQYSIKMYNILRLLNGSTGIVFIYSEYVADGVNVLGMALERNGFRHYAKGQQWNSELSEWESEKNNDMFAREHFPDTPEKRNYNGKLFSELEGDEPHIQGRFVVLKGEDMTEEQVDTYLKEVRGEVDHANLRGEHIKIVIGSKKIREGFSLHRIRQIHILDPWYHLNALDQAIGRGIRNKSHILLPPNERNVMVFIHCASMIQVTSLDEIAAQHETLQDVLPDLDQLTADFIEADEANESDSLMKLTLLETSDEYIYRQAYSKGVDIAKVERLLQRNAVDCHFNQNVNSFPQQLFDDIGVNPSQLLTFQGKLIDDYHIGNRNGSWKCDFTDCKYTCYGDTDRIIEEDQYPHIELTPLETDRLVKVKETIKQLYLLQFAYTLEEMFHKLDMAELTPEIFYQALTEIVDNQEVVQDQYLKQGYLIYRAIKSESDPSVTISYYIFQPRWEPYLGDNQIQDETIPMLMRQLPTMNQQQYMLLKPPLDTITESDMTGSILEQNLPETSVVFDIEQFRASLLGLYLYLHQVFERYYPLIPISSDGIPGYYMNIKFSGNDQIPLPTLYDLCLMAGFTLIDSLNEREELAFLEYLLVKIVERIYQTNDMSLNTENNLPDLEAVGFYYYLRDLPENIISKKELSVGQHVIYVDPTTGDRQSAEVIEVNASRRRLNILIDGIIRQNGISFDNIHLTHDISNSIFFEDTNFTIDQSTEEGYLPRYIRLINPEGIQNFYQIDISIEGGNITTKLIEVEHSSDPSVFQKILDYSLTNEPEYSNLNVGNDPSTGQYQSLVIGYYNPSADTARCGCVKRSPIGTVLVDLDRWNSQQIEEYLLSCFYVTNLLKVSSKSSESLKSAKEGACGLTGGKASKIYTVNILLSSTTNNPREPKFYRYPYKKREGVTQLPSIKDRYSNIVEEHPELAKISLDTSTRISDINVSLETMLLLRYFRFINKGVTSATPYRKWFFRKSEMYYAWSQSLDSLPPTFPVPGKGSKKLK